MLLAAAALVAAVVGGAFALTRSKGDDEPGAAGTPRPTPTVSTSPTVTPTSPTPTVSPTPTATAAAKPLPRVAASSPRRMVVTGLLDIGFDDAVAPHDGLFRAASTAEAARWGGRGVPASPARDTVYVVGKVSSGGAFEKLPKLRRGTRITLRTDAGVLTYTVQATATRAAQGLTSDPGFTKRVVGRLQLVGLRYDARGNRADTVLIVTAQLTSARRTG
ncbi:MAG: hypothetical protein ACJ72O_13095 [Marmoricola sp.]